MIMNQRVIVAWNTFTKSWKVMIQMIKKATIDWIHHFLLVMKICFENSILFYSIKVYIF